MTRKKLIILGISLFVVLLIAAIVAQVLAKPAPTVTLEEPIEKLSLNSPDFNEGEFIPIKFACDWENIPPTLSYDNIPMDTKSLAIVLTDQNSDPQGFVHWLAVNIPPSISQIAGGVLPKGASTMYNTNGDRKYFGPCPPKGEKEHVYTFTLYALSSDISTKGATLDSLLAEIKSKTISSATLNGLYLRPQDW